MKNGLRIKFTLIAFLSILLVPNVEAQTFGNEWINYSQPYLKCAVASNGIYRITGTELTSVGLFGAQGSNLQLFRDGKQIPIYVSTNGNIDAGNTYFEFYGTKADGTVDAPLFKNAADQMNKSQNLLSDTAFYFVTINTSGPHLRYDFQNNNLVSPPLKETYLWDVINLNYRGTLSQGPSYIGQSFNPVLYMYSSQFENSEGWVGNFSFNPININVALSKPYTTSGGPSASLNTTVAGFSYLTTHDVQIKVNGNIIADSTFGSFDNKRFEIAVPMSYVNGSNSLNFVYTPQNSIPSSNLYDRIGVSNLNLRYPRTLDFNNSTASYFELNPKFTDYYLELDNFNFGGVSPMLFDLEANKYIMGDISVGSKVRFLIPSSNNTKRFYLISQNNAPVKTVDKLAPVTFKNYTDVANQGDYIILSNSYYFDDGNGNNYVNDYKNYRSSSAGGSYSAIVADVDDIYNEFGYGYNFHIQGVKNFLNFASNSSNWLSKAQYAFIIGKGINYSSYLNYSTGRANNPLNFPYVAIPTFGVPASDPMITDFNMDNVPELSIGRLSVLNGAEIKPYLDKVKEHDLEIGNQTNQTAANVLWHKNILHIAGTSNASEQAPILFYLGKQKEIIEDVSYGGKVSTVAKSSSAPIQYAASAIIDNSINNGVSFIQFFGHGSSQSLDFNLDNPEFYLNQGKYPIFMANGCGVGNVFSTSSTKTLSERWIDADGRGSIAFIANTNTGLTNSLALYTDSLYGQIALHSYGNNIGDQVHENLVNMLSRPNIIQDNVFRLHAEQIILQGDPAAKGYGMANPDYDVEENSVIFKQLSITTNLDSFDVDVIVYNLGRYTKDTVDLIIDRTYPNNKKDTIIKKIYPGMAYSDTLRLRMVVGGSDAIGQNAIEVSMDIDNAVAEISETNNSIKKLFTIFKDDLVPVYPYDFSIVNQQGVVLKASTLNPFLETRQYVIQIDTTEKFNSNKLKTTRINSSGGVVKWQPNITFTDSVVYYWRTAMDTIYGNSTHRWTTSSFVFINQSLPGWNQSHYYQFAKDAYTNITLDSNSRKLKMNTYLQKLQVQNVCLNGPNPYQYLGFDYYAKINGVTTHQTGCDPFPGYESLQFMVIDTLSGMPWINEEVVGTGKGRFGSFKPCLSAQTPAFDFSFKTMAGRQVIMDFLDSIPQGTYVMMQPFLCIGGGCGGRNTIFVDAWQSDTLTLGSGNSLYHKLMNEGYSLIDSFTKNRPMIFFSRKGMPSTVKQYYGVDSTVMLNKEFDFISYQFNGDITSTKIGPASQWGSFLRSGYTTDAVAIYDTVMVDIIGIDKNKSETVLATVAGDTSLNFIDAIQYPNIRLVMHQKDTVYASPQQMKFWRVLYQPVPEAALNPNRFFVFKDSLTQGQNTTMQIAIENLTDIAMDSMLVTYDLIDPNNVYTSLGSMRYGPLAAWDTIIATLPFNSLAYSGQYLLKVEANPNNDQLEQFHPNNIGYKPLFIVPDDKNPLIDVTFDGIHILNKDIVSSKPRIQITLKDENKYLALDDTSTMKVMLRYPDNPNVNVDIPYDNNILKFFPASESTLSQKNEAKIEFTPTTLTDGQYELVLEGKDKAGNKSGTVSYNITFNVVNQPAISAVLNYPNPFSTSTQFVFTITGSEIPSDFKIQIMNMSGRVVREITKNEIGNLHIGRNLTDFRWKGDDQYGDLLGNGVYLYRVVSNLNGQKMDKFEGRNNQEKSQLQTLDTYFKNGFGKLYIMR